MVRFSQVIEKIAPTSQDQNLELQLTALEKIGCKEFYQDQISGRKSDRPGLQLALEVLRKGDTLVVWKLDRLGRNCQEIG